MISGKELCMPLIVELMKPDTCTLKNSCNFSVYWYPHSGYQTPKLQPWEKSTITFPRSHNTWSTTCPPKLIIKSKNHLIYAKEHRIWKPSFLSLLFCGKLLPYINLHPVTGWWVTNLLNPELSPFLATVQHTTSMLMPRVYESSVAWASLAPVHNKNSKHYLFIWRQEHAKYRSTETHGRPLQRLQTC